MRDYELRLKRNLVKMAHWPNKLVICLWLIAIVILLISYAENSFYQKQNEPEFRKVVKWLQEKAPGSEKFKDAFYNAGIKIYRTIKYNDIY